jgi:hypothetical protein
MDFIHRRQTRQSRDEEIDNFVSIHKKSSWSGMIIAAKSVYFLSTPLKSVYILSNPRPSITTRYAPIVMNLRSTQSVNLNHTRSMALVDSRPAHRSSLPDAQDQRISSFMLARRSRIHLTTTPAHRRTAAELADRPRDAPGPAPRARRWVSVRAQRVGGGRPNDGSSARGIPTATALQRGRPNELCSPVFQAPLPLHEHLPRL